MNQKTDCPKCGAELPVDAPAGLCPKCLVAAGFKSEPPQDPANDPTMGLQKGTPFELPTVEQLDVLFPQLEILELLGHGGMGAVYKARQKELDRLVAVKILPPEVGQNPAFKERFTREARAMARLNHPNIVTIHESGQTGSLFYFVMEYVEGANLRQTMQAKLLTPKEALAIVPQVCDALQYAHDEDIVHRDIKPENVLVNSKGNVKITDFGLSKLLSRQETDCSLTGTLQVMGTPRYMAPEQVQGTKSVDHRADIYSLGVVFYELLTGELPMGRFAPPSKKVQVDVRLDEVVLRTLEGEPERRYQQASEIKNDVEIISGSQVISPPETAPTETASDAVFFRWMTWVVGAAWAGWATLMAISLASYLQGAAWYFQQDDLLRRYLDTSLLGSSLMLFFFLATWWYSLAKSPGTPRSFSDFWKTFQTPDQRIIPLWIPACGFMGTYGVAVLVTMTLTSDTIQAITNDLFWVIAPLMFMISCYWAYGYPQQMDPGKGTPGEPTVWRGRPLTEIRFSVSDDLEVFSQAIFHFSALGYELVEQQPDACLFQRGHKWNSFWATDIRQLKTRLTVRTLPTTEGRLWVSCDWSMRTLGSWILRRDMEKLKAEGHGLEAMLSGAEKD